MPASFLYVSTQFWVSNVKSESIIGIPSTNFPHNAQTKESGIEGSENIMLPLFKMSKFIQDGLWCTPLIESNLILLLIELLASSFIFISIMPSKIELIVFIKFFDDEDEDEIVSKVSVKIAIASASCKIRDSSVINFIMTVSPNSVSRCVSESTTIRMPRFLSAAYLVFLNSSIVLRIPINVWVSLSLNSFASYLNGLMNLALWDRSDSLRFENVFRYCLSVRFELK